MNNHYKQKPVIFLAFANDRVSNVRYLRNISKENRGLRRVLRQAERAGLCDVVERPNVTVRDILDVFQDEKYKDRIAIFHFGGHNNGYKLLLETVAGARSFAHKEGLASFLARQNSLRLIFLNACSTQQHALELIQAGIPAVIGTSQDINDQVATQFSIRFYNGIANGFVLERAWRAAEDEIKIRKGPSNFNAMYHYSEQEKHPDRFPWDIYFAEGTEQVKEWNLLQISTTIKQVFISYSHKDKKFVNSLSSDLEKAGTSVWLDEKKIKVGDLISKKIEDGISKCDFFCLVISKHSVNSKWVEREYRTALNMQLSPGTTPKILPLLIEEVELPLLLREIKYADFSATYKSGLNDLLNAIKKQ